MEADETIEKWMTEWMTRVKPPVGVLHLSRFVERVYFLTKPITWKPGPDDKDLIPVTVPQGFLTDFASIPRIFWSVLPPDGEYTYSAIIHDFLYWEQQGTRETADRIFRIVMTEFRISSVDVWTIYNAVRLGGQSAWNDNATRKSRGERRILAIPPTDPTARWEEYKKKPGVLK